MSYSKAFTIQNSDLTSGEVLKSLTIEKTQVNVNETNTDILYPKSYVCFNDTESHIRLVFLTSGDLAEYAVSRDNFGGVIVGFETGNGQQQISETLEYADYVNIIADDPLAKPFNISFLKYNKKS